MSRRRPAKSKHLERDQVVAEQVAEVLDSRGDCPGQCNAAYRRLHAQWEREVYAEAEALQVKHPDASAVYVMELAQQRVRQAWSDAGRAAWPARKGTPVWCHRCTAEIRRALDRLPRLLESTLDLGVTVPRRADGTLVTDPVLVLWTSGRDQDGRVVDHLACGHMRTRVGSPIGPLFPTRCRTCIASASVPEPGRLAPPERLGRAGRRSPVSPAGSPAWVEVDAAVQWACSTADQVRYLLDGARDERFPWRTGSTDQLVRMARQAVHLLLDRLDVVLALPDPLPESIGRAARSVSARLEEVSGSAVKESPIAADCPACDRRGLVREDGSSLVHCRSCMAWFGEDELDRRLQEMGQAVTA